MEVHNGEGRGVFDISIRVSEGECYGFLGPNGAGKTTTIRHLMGFSRADSGTVKIDGLDCFENSALLKHITGYLPGELAFPSGLTGDGFLKMISSMHKGSSIRHELPERFHLDISKKTEEMSLGERRKLAIAAAFIHDPKILILDEPTSGLDPMMQQEFIKLIAEERARGKTVFLSSHIFSEVDGLCQKIGIIKAGHIISEFPSEELKNPHLLTYTIKFKDYASYTTFKNSGYKLLSDSEERLKLKIMIKKENLNDMVCLISALKVDTFHQAEETLEDYFMEFYHCEEEARCQI